MDLPLVKSTVAYSSGSEVYRYEDSAYLDAGPAKRHLRISRTTAYVPESNRELRLSATVTLPSDFAVESMVAALSQARGSKNFTDHKNTTVLADIPHPVVVTRCTPWLKVTSLNDSISYIQEDGLTKNVLTDGRGAIRAHLDKGATLNTTIDSLPPIWKPSPEPNSSALIGIFLHQFAQTVTSDNIIDPTFGPAPISAILLRDHQNMTLELQVFTCSISAFWADLETTMRYPTQEAIVPIAETPPIPDAGIKKVSHGYPISMSMEGRSSLGRVEFDNLTWKTVLTANPPDVGIGPLVASAFARSLSDYYPKRYGEDHYWREDWNPIEEPLKTLPCTIRGREYGYGYNTSSISVRLSLAVLTTYCVVAIAYLVYLLATGHTSTAWNSAIEFFILALQSRRPDHLGYSTVGVESMETFREGVGVRVNGEEQLEVVFANDKMIGKGEGLRKIVPNRAY